MHVHHTRVEIQASFARNVVELDLRLCVQRHPVELTVLDDERVGEVVDAVRFLLVLRLVLHYADIYHFLRPPDAERSPPYIDETALILLECEIKRAEVVFRDRRHFVAHLRIQPRLVFIPCNIA